MRLERVKSKKHSSDPIGNRTRELPAYSAVPQPTATAYAVPSGCPQLLQVKFLFVRSTGRLTHAVISAVSEQDRVTGLMDNAMELCSVISGPGHIGCLIIPFKYVPSGVISNRDC